MPALGVFGIKAKIDTGARTSALHVSSLVVREELADGTLLVDLTVAVKGRRELGVPSRARVLRRMKVTDSGGHAEVRPVIETEMVLGPVRERILLTLTDRAGMLFRRSSAARRWKGNSSSTPGKILLGRRRTRSAAAPAATPTGRG